MKLKDIADMEDYLENRCYCPHEIYDLTGFFYNCFAPDTECELLAEGERGAIHGTFVLTKTSRFNEGTLQIVYIEHRDGTVESCMRVDATENNELPPPMTSEMVSTIPFGIVRHVHSATTPLGKTLRHT